MTERAFKWEGTLTRDPQTGIVSGQIFDPFGFSIVLSAEKIDGGYRLLGVTGPIPDNYKIPWLDDDDAAPQHVADAAKAAQASRQARRPT